MIVRVIGSDIQFPSLVSLALVSVAFRRFNYVWLGKILIVVVDLVPNTFLKGDFGNTK